MAGTSSRVIAVGWDCVQTTHLKVRVSRDGRHWTTGTVPAGVRALTGLSIQSPWAAARAGNTLRLHGQGLRLPDRSRGRPPFL
jgi:hypothetical protein